MSFFNFFEQKSPQQRFLFILGLAMFFLYFFIGIVLIFTNLIPIDEEQFPRKYQISFGIVIIIYSGIRFFRIMKDNSDK